MKVIAVIPAYNEESTIADIVKRTLKYVDTVIVVDNNSTDLTRFKAKDAGAFIVMEYKQGAGATTRAGIMFAQKLNPDIILTLDGDGQHNPDDMPLLLKSLEDGTADVVIGSRFLSDYKISRYRKFGIDIITWLYNVGHKDKITDAQCCFRAFKVHKVYIPKLFEDVIEFSIVGVCGFTPIIENGFGFSTEVLIRLRKGGFRISEVSIPCVYHKDFKQNSTLNPIRHGLEVAFKTIYWRLKLWN